MTLFAEDIILGFTGSQQGMSDEQKIQFAEVIMEQQPTEFHHGDCIGSDAQAHLIVRLVCPECKIIIHPPINDSKRAFMKGDTILPPKEYLARNKDIVNACIGLVATPTGLEKIRSGTWSTIRYAHKQGKTTKIL